MQALFRNLANTPPSAHRDGLSTSSISGLRIDPTLGFGVQPLRHQFGDFGITGDYRLREIAENTQIALPVIHGDAGIRMQLRSEFTDYVDKHRQDRILAQLKNKR